MTIELPSTRRSPTGKTARILKTLIDKTFNDTSPKNNYPISCLVGVNKVLDSTIN
ncbi:hypothetical protein [Calothrix sp. 336/3]|uniref:hypothetical protein n=1 Tax=Calothrix sp. 336/3 TaxID=1337936 RepID=UPI000AB21EC4|nr:hypothetical protein [Calothrix sp. 336/3]